MDIIGQSVKIVVSPHHATFNNIISFPSERIGSPFKVFSLNQSALCVITIVVDIPQNTIRITANVVNLVLLQMDYHTITPKFPERITVWRQGNGDDDAVIAIIVKIVIQNSPIPKPVSYMTDLCAVIIPINGQHDSFGVIVKKLSHQLLLHQRVGLLRDDRVLWRVVVAWHFRFVASRQSEGKEAEEDDLFLHGF